MPTGGHAGTTLSRRNEVYCGQNENGTYHGVCPERFVEDDRMYFLNDNYITMYHRPDFGWFEDDGTVFLRKSDSDAYEARYGGYCEAYIVPSFQGVLTGLAT